MSKSWRKNRRRKLEDISPICQFGMFSWCCWMLTTSAAALIFVMETDTPCDSPRCPPHQEKERKKEIIAQQFIFHLTPHSFFPLHVTFSFFDYISRPSRWRFQHTSDFSSFKLVFFCSLTPRLHLSASQFILSPLKSLFFPAILRQECPVLSSLWIAEKRALLVEKPRAADLASCCTLAGSFSIDLFYICSLFESGVPPGGMASFLVHFSSQAFATLSYRSSAFSRGLFHIGNLLHSLRAEPRGLWLSSPFLFLKLPFFFFFFFPDCFSLQLLECWHCVPTCLPLNIPVFVWP